MPRKALPLLAALAIGCSQPDPVAPVVHQYAVNLDANYKDVIARLEDLQAAVDAFVAAPSADLQVAAQQAYLAVRPWYGECEVSRFYGGPMDQAQGGMNEWPIDEAFIDYTVGNPLGGIINDPTDYPQLTATVLATADEKGGLENLSTGFHAIELLLWGQRAAQTDGPGQRPYTDFVDGGTAANQDRRRTYLSVATQLLLDDMRGLEAQWDLTDKKSYGAELVAGSSKDGLTKMYRGFSQMAISELLYERMSDPFRSQDRKDEESCFSESTSIDLNANMLGVEDVWLGQYHDLQGPSVQSLVAAKDPALAAQVTQQLATVKAAIAAIPPPFDHAVIADPSTPEHQGVQAAIDAFAPVQGLLDQAAGTLGIVNNL
jgi:putative iron-regulated protein